MSAPSQGQRRDAYKNAHPAEVYDFPIRQHDTATGQRAINEAADYLETLGGVYGGMVAFLRCYAGGWSA